MLPENPKEKKEQIGEMTKRNLSTLKSQVDKPWQVKFLRESKDKKYDIYGYKLVQWGTKWWIKNKYITQVWPWIEWTQFTDANWNEIKKDRFVANEVVYLRVPKNETVKEKKETKDIPWKFKFIKKMKDNQGRNRKIYSYIMLHWGNDTWIENRFVNQVWPASLLPGRNFCDKNWNITKRGYHNSDFTPYQQFGKWEKIYIRVPDMDIVDNIPEMTMDDINRLSSNEIKKITDSYETFCGSDARWHRWSIYEHADKNGVYIMMNGKKLYIQYLFGDHRIMKSKKPCVLLEFHEGGLVWMKMWKYDWKVFRGIDINVDYWEILRRWIIELDEYWYR